MWTTDTGALTPPPVAGLFLGGAVGAAMLAIPKFGDGVLRKVLFGISIAFMGPCIFLGIFDPKSLQQLGAKLNVLDWVSAVFLLAAAVIAWGAVICLHRQGRPSPMAAILAAGFTWAALREMHYGGDFVGEKIWFTRNILHLSAWMGPSYFEQFRQMEHVSATAQTLFLVHICFTLAAAAITAVVIRYILRHRTPLVSELLEIPRTFHGRLWLMGMGLFIVSELLGGLLHRMPQWSPDGREFWHTSVEESLECWGTIVILFCAAALWQKARRTAPPFGAHHAPASK